MSIDKAKLKALAMAATQGVWVYDGSTLNDWESGSYSMEWMPNGEDCEGGANANFKADGAFMAAANPAAVLELIAENDRVIARLCVCRDCGGQGEIYSGRHADQGYFQPPEPVMRVCGTCDGDGVLGPLEDFEAMAAERDQLKAENAGLKTGYEAWERAHADLAEKLREAHSQIAAMGKGEQS